MHRRPLLVLFTLVMTVAGLGVAPADARQVGADGTEAALLGVAQIDAGGDHTCAVLENGQVRCWGISTYRQLGNGSTTASARPVVVSNIGGTGPLANASHVSTGGNHACARLTNGEARCWGYNVDGQLGAGANAPRTRAVAVLATAGSAHLTGVRQIVAGWTHTCAVLTNGQVRCWGRNTYGQLGDGTTINRNRPRAVVDIDGDGPLTGITQISLGFTSTCARLGTGRVACWGGNSGGQLGNGTTSARRTPGLVLAPNGAGPLGNVAEVQVGEFHACARLANGQARCWGQNTYGELGAGTGPGRPRPVVVSPPGGNDPITGMTQLAVGENHTCARLTSKQVRCWGRNTDGPLGDRSTTNRARAVAMVSGIGTVNLTGAREVATGGNHSCVRIAQGQVLCVGANAAGQLGDATNQATTRPVGVRR